MFFKPSIVQHQIQQFDTSFNNLDFQSRSQGVTKGKQKAFISLQSFQLI